MQVISRNKQVIGRNKLNLLSPWYISKLKSGGNLQMKTVRLRLIFVSAADTRGRKLVGSFEDL